MTSKTVVIPAGVDEIVEDAIPACGRVDKLYLKEGAAIDWLPGHANWDCVKLPQSQRDDFFGSKEPWMVVTNGFFSGTDVQQPEFTFKKCDDECVRWMELRPREFQYVCSLAFELPREECDEVVGRWLFTRSPKSGELLLRLASAFMNGTEVEQDIPMALRCCEQACWCATGTGIPFTAGEAFSGIEVAAVDQFGDREVYQEWIDLYERADRLKEEVLTHFQRLDIREFERRSFGSEAMYVIPDNAFEGRQDLRDVLLPDELCDKHVRLGARAFAHCANLRSISVSDVRDTFALSRQADSFDGCAALTDRIQYSADGTKVLFCLNAPEHCVICDHVHAIANYAFAHSGRLSDFRWESTDYTYAYCRAPRKIGIRAFEGCDQLSSVFTGGNEVSLRSRAFASCRHLSLYRFGYGDIEVDSGLPPALLDVSGTGAFDGCEMLGFIEPGLGPDKGFLVLKDDAWRGCQFSGCRMLHILPPVISTGIPPYMFADCAFLYEVRCVATRPEVIKSVLSRKHPDAHTTEGDFSICARAFAGCNALERFKFCRLRVSLRRGAEAEVELIDDNPKQVLFEHEAFLDCCNLRRHESSFAGSLIGSDPSAFCGCPDFEGFVSE